MTWDIHGVLQRTVYWGLFEVYLYYRFCFVCNVFIFGCPGSRCCAGSSLVAESIGGCSPAALHGLLIAGASLAEEQGL